MKAVLFPALGLAAVVELLLLPAVAQVNLQDTTGPNQFHFTQTNLVVTAGATHVTLEVRMNPGDRGFSGSVDYYTQDGTAQAGRDYTAISGTLSMSWPGVAWLEVPIHADAFDSGEKSFRVFLSNTNAIIWNSPATVIVQGVPRLQIVIVDSSLVVSWPAAFEGCILERREALDMTWSEVATPAELVADRWQVEEPLSGPGYFYRLRH